ncbi:MAG: FecR domain-containing protein [Spirochaetia bacterium]|nr:FecR domain-containing protein [Spirochaetia bacterium]
MKRAVFFVLFFVACFCYAQDEAVLSYVDGMVDIRYSDGELTEAAIGDEVCSGESVITHSDGFAELVQYDGCTYKISPDTVFTVGKVSEKGTVRSVLSCIIGKVLFKFQKMVGSEPLIATGSTTAGIRGTEFCVYAGSDGSSLIAVTAGKVAVEAEGHSVELVSNEAVEVVPGQAPGEKFVWLGKEQDFSTWNDSRKKRFDEDPADALLAVENRLMAFEDKIDSLVPVYENDSSRLKEELRKFEQMKTDGEDMETLVAYRDQVIAPLQQSTFNLIMNIRYYSLSALSMRRYIVGSLYADMKTRYICDLENPVFKKFIKVYDRILSDFEQLAVPQLVDADI